jgi:hypothetical protein
VPKVLTQILHQILPPHVRALLLDERNVAKFRERGALSISRRQSGGAVEFDLAFDVTA